jgi:rhamnosyltransferase
MVSPKVPFTPTNGRVPFLSVLIRARNEAQRLRQVFEALSAQRCSFSWEIIVVDNDSEDETRELCREFNASVVRIGRDEFTYGRALNMGISEARGTLVLILSAHSLPVGSYFLESAVSPFADPLIAAVRCLRSDSGQLKHWYKPRDIQYQSRDEQQAEEKGGNWTSLYPAANGCVIRRSVWEENRYDEDLESNEDKVWASGVLEKGFKLRCCAEAVFVYTRKRSKRDLWKRHNLDYLALYRFSGHPPLSWSEFLARIAKALVRAPLLAASHVYDTVVWNTALVTIPWQARAAKRTGSLAEFDKHK